MSYIDDSHDPESAQKRRRILIGIASMGVVCLAVVGAFGLKYLAAERDRSARRTSALQIVQNNSGDFSKAVDDLKEFVLHHPKDVDAFAALARATLRVTPSTRQTIIDAARSYYRLLEVDPTRADDRFEMIRLLDLIGESDALVKAIDPLIEQKPTESLPQELRTLHLIRLGKIKEAQASAKQWAEMAPNDFKAQITYVGLLSGGGKDQHDADSYLNTKVASNPNKDVATLVRAAWLLGSNQTKDASDLIDSLLAKPTRDASLNRYLISTLDQLQRSAEADKLCEAAIAGATDDSLVILSAIRDMDRSNHSRALSTLVSAKPQSDPSRQAAQLCVKAYLGQRTGKTDVADGAIQELKAIPIQYGGPWMAALQALNGDRIEKPAARDLLPQLRASVLIDDVGGLLQLATANCLISLDQDRMADRMLVEASRLPIGWTLPARRLIELRRSRREVVQAIEAAQYAFNRSGRTIDTAINLALSVAESKPTGMLAENHVILLREIQRAIPGEVQTLGLFVEALAKRGDPSAQDVLHKAVARETPIPADILLQWADLSQRLSLGVEGECLERATKDFGVMPRIAMARANLLRRAGKDAEALAELRDTREKNPKDRRAYEEVIATFLLQSRSRDAAEAWSALASAYPQDVELQIRVLELGVSTSTEQTRALIERVRKVEPANATAEIADIRLALAEKRDAASTDAALIRLTRVVDRLPDLISARLLLIDVLASTDNAKAALAQWERAYAIAPTEPSILLSGAQLLIASGDRNRSAEVMRTVDRLDANLNPIQRLEAARIHTVLGHASRSIEMLEAMTDLPSTGKLLLAEAYYRVGDVTNGKKILDQLLVNPNLDVLLFAAAVEDAQGKKDGADAYLQRAHDLAELNDDERLRVAEYASERGGLERVIGLISASNVSNDVTIRIARLWVEQGEVDAAMKALNQAAAKSADSEPLRRRMKDEQQVRLLVAAGLKQVASRLLETPDDPGTQQMVRFALETQKQSVRDQQMALDKLATQGESNFALQMFVAERYLAANQPMLAEKHARLAAEARPSLPQPLALAVMATSRAGNTGRCAENIRDWRNRLPADSTQPDAIDARNLARRREYTELLARYEPRLANTGQLSVDVIFALAEAMHARGRDDDAIALLNPVVESDSRLSIAWAEMAASEVTPAAAWKSIDALRAAAERRQLPTERVAFAVAADRVARKVRNTTYMEQSLKSLVELEARVGELPAECVSRLAENRVERGELADAERIYRQSLTSRQDVAALQNNLAEVLRKQSKLDDALKTIDQALAADGSMAAMHDTRASILQDAKQFDTALLAATTAQQKEPLNPKWLLRVATIQQAKGELVTARSSLETLQWFFREPDVWNPELIERFRALTDSLTRKPTTGPGSTADERR